MGAPRPPKPDLGPFCADNPAAHRWIVGLARSYYPPAAIARTLANLPVLDRGRPGDPRRLTERDVRDVLAWEGRRLRKRRGRR